MVQPSADRAPLAEHVAPEPGVADRHAASRPPCRRSPTPSAIRPAGGSTCSPATPAATRASPPSAVALEVGVHPNVARHHLDKLAAGGYVEVVRRVASTGGRRAGRPSKRYVAVANAELDVPVRSDDLVLALLGRALDRLPAPRGRGDGRGGRRHVRPGDGHRAHRRRARRRAALAALGDAGRRRRPHRPRLRRPHAAGAQRWSADHQRPLPVRRRGHRSPGDLRRRPGHGPGHAQRARRPRRRRRGRHPGRKAHGDTFCATAV